MKSLRLLAIVAAVSGALMLLMAGFAARFDSL